jgi:hypothetical protein
MSLQQTAVYLYTNKPDDKAHCTLHILLSGSYYAPCGGICRQSGMDQGKTQNTLLLHTVQDWGRSISRESARNG